MSFLPDNYEAPKTTSGYMKIQDGENKFRILSRPIIGWEDWTADKKPVRFRFENKPEKSIHPTKPIRHFWSFIVFCYDTQKIQILHISQASIRNKIQSLSQDKDWGDPFFYDLKILKSGHEKETTYDVNPLPHKELPASIIQAFNETPIFLEALFDNQDPFSKEWRSHTEGVFARSKDINTDKIEVKVPTNNELDELHSILSACSVEYQKQVDESLKKMGKKLSEIDSNTYIRLLTAAKKKKEEFSLSNIEELPF